MTATRGIPAKVKGKCKKGEGAIASKENNRRAVIVNLALGRNNSALKRVQGTSYFLCHNGVEVKVFASRLLTAILVSAVAASVYSCACKKIKITNPFRVTHSSENNSPYSVLEGRTVRLKPYDATFDIPESWLTPKAAPAPAKNLYLSWQDLSELYWRDGADAEDAQVINSVLSFEACAAHVGDRDWGNYFWNDLQSRVYVVDLTPEEIAARIETHGLNEALCLFEGASLASESHGVWRKSALRILDAPTHFSLMKALDFYYRSIRNKTVVFVFLHAGGFDEDINGILSSFKW